MKNEDGASGEQIGLGRIYSHDLRCPQCGSYAISARFVDPLPGSVTEGNELELKCRDCLYVVTNTPDRALEWFIGHEGSAKIAAALDRASATYCEALIREGE